MQEMAEIVLFFVFFMRTASTWPTRLRFSGGQRFHGWNQISQTEESVSRQLLRYSKLLASWQRSMQMAVQLSMEAALVQTYFWSISGRSFFPWNRANCPDSAVWKLKGIFSVSTIGEVHDATKTFLQSTSLRGCFSFVLVNSCVSLGLFTFRANYALAVSLFPYLLHSPLVQPFITNHENFRRITAYVRLR